MCFDILGYLPLDVQLNHNTLILYSLYIHHINFDFIGLPLLNECSALSYCHVYESFNFLRVWSEQNVRQLSILQEYVLLL